MYNAAMDKNPTIITGEVFRGAASRPYIIPVYTISPMDRSRGTPPRVSQDTFRHYSLLTKAGITLSLAEDPPGTLR